MNRLVNVDHSFSLQCHIGRQHVKLGSQNMLQEQEYHHPRTDERDTNLFYEYIEVVTAEFLFRESWNEE